MQDFRNLKVWEKAHMFTLDAYQAREHFHRRNAFA